mmetsp:Transcript_23464/g.34804  ORF Transcript_23464/g.34804 Transcript_23464/m.34804 type:complete len:606 (+) Transcript_23464:214-2031(+)
MCRLSIEKMNHLHLNAAPCPELMTSVDRIKHKIFRKKFPVLGRALDSFYQLNPLFQSCAIASIVLWKIFIIYFFVHVVLHKGASASAGAGDLSVIKNAANVNVHASNPNPASVAALRTAGLEFAAAGKLGLKKIPAPFTGVGRQAKAKVNAGGENNQVEALALPIHSTDDKPIRVLHIVTALRDINNGQRGTEHGEDRLVKVFIPVLKNSVESMIAPPYNYQVDVYLVLGWTLTDERRKLIEDALPEGVGLQIWNDAIPLAYDKPSTDVKLKPVTRGLARQHRYVIKDKLEFYDVFSVFEDDMRVSGAHMAHFLEQSAELERLADEAPDTLPAERENPYQKQSFHGALSKKQLRRMMPGFIRVEVLLDEKKFPSQRDLDNVPIDLDFEDEDGGVGTKMFDPKPCCHVPENIGKMPPSPTGDQVMIWETGVKGTVVRKMPAGGNGLLDWVMLQPGPKSKGQEFIGGFWSGMLGLYGDEKKPGAGDPRLIAQQGGWMATREQLIEMHNNQCPDGFFPPYSNTYKQEGLTLNNVEFWSGGFSIFSGTRSGCNMQRVVSLNPEEFGKHFIYHTANNKQKSLPNFRLLKANNFMGQINSVVKAAKKAMGN